MIAEIIYGDIVDLKLNSNDIIIAMNTKLAEASALGRPFVYNVKTLDELELGSVLTFKFDETRLLHMLICHQFRSGGWVDSEKYVRYCLDYLWQQHRDRQYAIVQIGNGYVGRRDGADAPVIRTAMADSFLNVNLFIQPEVEEARTAAKAPLGAPFLIWDMERGEREIQVH